jgi:hypothetical protein
VGKKKSNTINKKEGKLCNNAQIMENFINNYFASPLPQMKASIFTNAHEALKFLFHVFKHPFRNTHMTPVTNKEIKDIVKSLKLRYSYEYDEIPQHILKISLPFILLPLSYMCNKSLSLGVFPMRLKYSQINPIFKKGDRTDVANYRPISVLTFFLRFLKSYLQ